MGGRHPFADLGRNPFPGSSVTPGWAYHEVPGVEGPFHRGGTAARVAAIVAAFPVAGKVGLDIGCNVGGLTLGLHDAGATMTGVDGDPAAVAVARGLAGPRGPHFLEVDATEALRRAPRGGAIYDFALLLSVFMWLAKANGRAAADDFLADLSGVIPVLFFETAVAGDGLAGDASGFSSQDDVAPFLRLFYPEVTDLGVPVPGWGNRRLFLCQGGGR